MLANLSPFDILNWMHGCAIGSHLRQDIWRRAADEFYAKLTPRQRLTVYIFAKRDLTPIFLPHKAYGEEIPHVAHDDFFHFLARYNPANQYLVRTKDEEKDTTVEAYLYNGQYRVSFYSFVAKENIYSVERVDNFERCGLRCIWHANCARYTVGHVNEFGFYPGSKCEWFINEETEHGADPIHFTV